MLMQRVQHRERERGREQEREMYPRMHKYKYMTVTLLATISYDMLNPRYMLVLRNTRTSTHIRMYIHTYIHPCMHACLHANIQGLEGKVLFVLSRSEVILGT